MNVMDNNDFPYVNRDEVLGIQQDFRFLAERNLNVEYLSSLESTCHLSPYGNFEQLSGYESIDYGVASTSANLI